MSDCSVEPGRQQERQGGAWTRRNCFPLLRGHRPCGALPHALLALPLPPVAGRLFPVMSPSHSFLFSSNDTVLPFLLGKSYTQVDLMDPEHDGVWGGREADPHSSSPHFVVSGYLTGPSAPSSDVDASLGQSSTLPSCLLASRSDCTRKTLA